MYLRTIKKRGATVVVEADASLLALPTSPVGYWYRRFNDRVADHTKAAAPFHDYAKRPLRPHPGPHLKDTIVRGKTKAHHRGAGFKLYSAVGSSAGYALFVDQGTAPTTAKILPPWSPGSGSLYEATWKPSPNASPVGPMPTKGQEGKFFFDEGLRRGFLSMRMRSAQVPAERGVFSGSDLNIRTLGADFFSGNNDHAFRMRLNEWRKWRDYHWNAQRELYHKAHPDARRLRRRKQRSAEDEYLRESLQAVRKARRAAKSAERSRRWREKQKAERQQQKREARANDRRRFTDWLVKKYGAQNVDNSSIKYRDGRWHYLVRVKDDRGRWVWKERSARAKS